jgi:O-methyltransferase
MQPEERSRDGARWAWRRRVFRAKRALKQTIKGAVRKAGYDIVPYTPQQPPDYPVDFTPEHISIVKEVLPYTLTSPERIFEQIEAVRHIVRNRIAGGVVECGVWRGGSMMAAALALLQLNVHDRDLYLFDTFQGMPKPDAVDVEFSGSAAMDTFHEQQIGEDSSESCLAELADVQTNMARTNYDPGRIHFIQGKVEDSLPGQAPETIALLRLDTDWYSSTRHELEHLFPRLSPGGILIVDDYGHWEGARKATDEYLSRYAPALFLGRIDYTARIAVKNV